MPLKPGHSTDVVSGNIKELMGSGRSQKQAIAIALAEKRKSERKHLAEGGEVEFGGTPGINPLPTESALAEALTDPNEETQHPVEHPHPVSNQALSEDAKRAILDKKKRRIIPT